MKVGDIVVYISKGKNTWSAKHLVKTIDQDNSFTFDMNYNAEIYGGYSHNLWTVVGNISTMHILERIIYGIEDRI